MAAPVTRGKRVVIPTSRPQQASEGMYVCGHKPLLFGEFTLTDGVEVPGAAGWSRVEAWVAARRIRRLAPGEKCTSFASFTAVPEEAVAAEE